MRRALVLVFAAALVGSLVPLATAQSAPPRTAFEENGGSDWTSHEEEMTFLRQVDRGSARMTMHVIGTTKQGRPLHLVRVGDPAPRSRADALRRPSILFVCSQHGNEPAGREACLQWLRNLAFTTNPTLVRQLQNHAILFIPNANPDGRAANTRGNSDGVDINRDHLNLETLEGRAMARVVRDWKPDVSMDLHEYSQIPVVYDDELLFLWPRNLNADSRVHSLAMTLALEYLSKGVERAGFSADEYGQLAIADQDIHQIAGDADEGIMRNAMGLRHSLGILVESDAMNRPENGEINSSQNRNRRVASQNQSIIEALRFMRDQGVVAKRVTARAPLRKIDQGLKRSRPLYFGGADNERPSADEVQWPPPCAYRLTETQSQEVRTAFDLHGITAERRGRGVVVPMGQAAEPVIGLLLDGRGRRHAVEGQPVMDCSPRT